MLVLLAVACRPGGTAPEVSRDDKSRTLCPPHFAYHPGGTFTIVREGARWGAAREKRYQIALEPFCLAQYEASQPGATAIEFGRYSFGQDVPPAQVKRGVKPWIVVSWVEAMMAVTQQGWRLPAYEELQAAASSGDPERLWVHGPKWDCRKAELSWFETCRGVRMPQEGAGVTGGPSGRSNYGLPWYDFLGGVAEMTSTPWNRKCYGLTRFSLFGHAFLAGRGPAWETTQEPNPDKPGCWLFSGFAGTIRGEHEHDYLNRTYRDDGFRPAVAPSPHWATFEARTQAAPVKFPLAGWYFDPETGKKVAYEIPRPESVTGNRPPES
ncbi:MAG: SUMF1/EgtB/PvdO family nonheme iron enzyme [Candidatus Lernaella stagnicola]|nr:SUMF1/EgtB/PvdO family nonheme iron enzyme [Candidatus Lernaella stagnicola]